MLINPVKHAALPFQCQKGLLSDVKQILVRDRPGGTALADDEAESDGYDVEHDGDDDDEQLTIGLASLADVTDKRGGGQRRMKQRVRRVAGTTVHQSVHSLAQEDHMNPRCSACRHCRAGAEVDAPQQ